MSEKPSFWKTLLPNLRSGDYSEGYGDITPATKRAAIALLNEAVPGSANYVETVHGEPLLYALLTDLMFYSSPEHYPSPRVYPFEPANVTLHTDPEVLRQMLYAKKPMGTTAVYWNRVNVEPGWSVSHSGSERMVKLVRGFTWLAYQCKPASKHASDQRYEDNEGSALVFIRDEHLDVYPFPENWMEIVDGVHRDLKRMNARQKGEKDLPVVLRAYVNLLGWEAVNAAIQMAKS